MKLYMDGSNIDVQYHEGKIGYFGTSLVKFLYMNLARHVEKLGHVEKALYIY